MLGIEINTNARGKKQAQDKKNKRERKIEPMS